MVRRVSSASVLVLLATALACSSEPRDGSDGDGDGDSDGLPAADAGPTPDGGGGPVGDPVVYAHTRSELYRATPDTFHGTFIGAFVWPMGAPDGMTDIAIDADGIMVGVSSDSVYGVDTATAVATFKAPLSREFNGLSFLPAGAVDPGQEVLVGTTLDGSVWRIDPDTGASTQLGEYGGGWRSSGDIVSVDGFGTVATVNTGGLLENDTLAFVNPMTGAATPIGTGNTGYDRIWGVGFWKGKVFGFTEDQEFLLIDVVTGVATTQELGNQLWWGAGVTTSAPIIP